ncbi:stage II sporulation protein D [Natranaerovirga pectinivora]|uniref:Stage II sporulation protein D n=1 Tax=Natranaerovirga pectinivora TaxID=682400 RepID=A0A4R3MRF6_9FIRM|nr:SpoIID/LytB domain-containing protein [Natranaerovirga pectinivora]TCT15357.1 stage II sporulation protein D [Natranaerovirga pectinivora]
MKKIFFILGVILLLVGCSTRIGEEKKNDNFQEKEEEKIIEIPNNDGGLRVIEGDKPISRALAAKMVALGRYSRTEVSHFDREIPYQDTDASLWYDKYINVVTIYNWFGDEGDFFRPLELLTYSEALEIADRIEVSLEELNMEVRDDTLNTPIKYKDWFSIYSKLLEELDIDEQVRRDSLVVVGTPANISSLNAWELVSDKGKYAFEGLTMDQFIDNEIRVLRRENDIIGVIDIITNEPVITNVWIEKIDDVEGLIFVGGEYRTYNINKEVDSEVIGLIGDIHIKDRQIVDFALKEETISGKVLRINNNEVLLEGLGSFPVASDRKIYSNINNNLQWRTISQVLVGYNSADFVIQDGEVQGIVIRKRVEIENIRVAIRTTGFNALVHNEIQLTSDVDFTIKYGNEIAVYEKNKVVRIDSQHPVLEDYITITPNDPKGKIEILSIERAYGTPRYRGVMEIARASNGLYLINELPMEEYLYSVVPSEMPTSYGLEAAKVQAICARSYAYSQFYSNRYSSYGGHVDDSVSSQVYNNYRENEISIQAVNETSKLGITYNDNVVSAFFFSTSSGHTADSGDVWANWSTRSFPTTTPVYSRGKPQFNGEFNLDLTVEEDFAAFIKNDNYNAYDRNISWYRWQVTMTREQLTKSINNNLVSRFEASPHSIKVLGEDNYFRTRPIETIGELIDIRVYSRGNSGVLTEVLIIGTENTIKVATEYNIRFLLAPKRYSENEENIIITRKDGSTVSNYNLLPSAFFTMDKKFTPQNNLAEITFYGGGFGHGVGMSQNGVKGMVDLGYSYDEVLKHFYTGVEIKKIY